MNSYFELSQDSYCHAGPDEAAAEPASPTYVISVRVIPVVATSVVLLLIMLGCGPNHLLGEYDFGGRSVAVLALPAPVPELITPGVSLGRNPLATAVSVGSRAAVEVEGRQAQARLDSAATNIDVSSRINDQTLERASPYLGARPISERDGADFLLEMNIRSLAIDAQRTQAMLVLSAEATLLDGHTGREIWSAHVRNRGLITPRVATRGMVPGQAITAAALTTVSVEEFEQILERTADMTADWIAGQLREDLRDVRR